MKKKESSQTTLNPNAPRLYDSKEAAAFLKCSVVTLRNYVRAGQLHPQRVGTRYLFTEADLLRLVQCGTDSRYSAFIKARREGRRLTSGDMPTPDEVALILAGDELEALRKAGDVPTAAEVASASVAGDKSDSEFWVALVGAAEKRKKGPTKIDLDLANRVMQAAKCAAGPEEFLGVLKELLGAK